MSFKRMATAPTGSLRLAARRPWRQPVSAMRIKICPRAPRAGLQSASFDAPARRVLKLFDAMEKDMMLAPWGSMASRFPISQMFPTREQFRGDLNLDMNLDFHETDQGFELEADLPGMKKEDIAVDVDSESGVLTVSAERRKEEVKADRSDKARDDEGGDKKFHFVERSYGKTVRSIRLPDTANAGEAKASYSNGVLKLTFPKKEISTSHRLQISVGGGTDDETGGEAGKVPIGQRDGDEDEKTDTT